ncbi:MAG: hypothetical protein AUJ18_08175 [Candidatus Hydrogenedentes bacterium CG1_02_42_14]|nr:MAG: hypothetical protein AUJ18_08175 [Candidatus Hydrogenedentes bacterium CG1_02_42_14]
MKRILVIGGTSAMIRESLRMFAKEGSKIYITGRTESKLTSIADELKVLGADVKEECIDLDLSDEHLNFIKRAAEYLEKIDIAILAHGINIPQAEADSNIESGRKMIQTNFVSYVSLLTLIANQMIEQGSGKIAAIVSVAGDRGRQSNFLYGATKAALDTYLSGLRNKLHKYGIKVISIKPGYVDTPMTASFPHNPLFTSAKEAGELIFKAISVEKDIVYIPWFWRWILTIIKIIPEQIFKRMRL